MAPTLPSICDSCDAVSVFEWFLATIHELTPWYFYDYGLITIIIINNIISWTRSFSGTVVVSAVPVDVVRVSERCVPIWVSDVPVSFFLFSCAFACLFHFTFCGHWFAKKMSVVEFHAQSFSREGTRDFGIFARLTISGRVRNGDFSSDKNWPIRNCHFSLRIQFLREWH